MGKQIPTCPYNIATQMVHMDSLDCLAKYLFYVGWGGEHTSLVKIM